jgi:predicted 3-demethylubiquinone-9 3-methyltransferase (glyoxalase superfamily)
MQKMISCLWFDNEAEEAARFYVSVFPNSAIGRIDRYGESAAQVAGRPEGSVLTVNFSLNGNEFVGLNGGPLFKFSEAISFIVNCETQEEVDYYWEKLTDGGSEQQCGWLKDRYGVSWQIVPAVLERFLASGESEKTERAMSALLEMKKLDINALTRAYEGEP